MKASSTRLAEPSRWMPCNTRASCFFNRLFGTFDNAVTATRLGAAAFKAKPVSGDDLAAVLGEVIANRIQRTPAAMPPSSEAEWLEAVSAERADCVTKDRLTTVMTKEIADPLARRPAVEDAYFALVRVRRPRVQYLASGWS